MWTLSAREMTVFVGRMRVPGANARPSDVGFPAKRPATPSHDFS